VWGGGGKQAKNQARRKQKKKKKQTKKQKIAFFFFLLFSISFFRINRLRPHQNPRGQRGARARRDEAYG
jgi:hypothetical protein